METQEHYEVSAGRRGRCLEWNSLRKLLVQRLGPIPIIRRDRDGNEFHFVVVPWYFVNFKIFKVQNSGGFRKMTAVDKGVLYSYVSGLL